ncbi:helix-turn-helix domain-containing protein [Salmonella enterica]|nr:helix-turn-helix domain-containing protein [Salmonella enterica subsp. enterica serovar Muenchen]EHR0292326.1 helix-turn-helix domain-containing protein [Salmonella enterica]
MLKDILRARREQRKLKQSDMAKLLGVTTQTYLKWENGVYEPRASQIKRLAEILDISEIEICRGYLFQEPEYYDVIDFITEIDKHRQWVKDTEFMAIVYKYIYEKSKFINELKDKAYEHIEAYQEAMKRR